MKTPPTTTQNNPPDGSFRSGRAFEVLVATAIGAVLLTLLGWILFWTVLRNVAVSPAELRAVRAALAPRWVSALQPEPGERWLYVLLCLAAPVCALGALVLARPVCRRLSRVLNPSGQTSMAVIAGLACFGVLFVKTRFGFWLLPFQDLGNFFAVFPMSYWGNAGAILLAAALLLPAIPGGSLRFRLLTRNRRRAWGVGAVVLGAALLFLPRAISVDSARAQSLGSWAMPMHFQACVFGLTQLYAGKALSLTMPLYGGYAEFLVPVFRLFGLSVLKVSLAMTALCAVALASNLLVLARFVRQPAILFLSTATFLYAFTGTWTAGQVPFDPYFQYLPVRVLFPALSIPLYLWAAGRNGRASWLAMGAFCGLAVSWNLDSGIAVAGATFFTATAEAVARALRKSGRGAGAIDVALAAIGMAAVWLGFSLYLQWQTQGVRPLHTTAEYQRLFYEFGLLMIPIPDGVHPWMLVLGIYLMAFILGLRSLLNGRHSPFARVSVFLSVLGAGLFTYYQGRSHDYNLIIVAWPSIILAFLLVDRLLRAIRADIFAPGLRWLAFPALYLGVVSVCMFPSKTLILARDGLSRWRAALSASPARPSESIRGQVDFIRAHVGTDRTCAILTVYQTVHYAETGFQSPYNLPSVTEMFFKSDLEALQRALTVTPARHVFVDPSTAEVLELLPVLTSRYRVVARYGNREMACLEPISIPKK